MGKIDLSKVSDAAKIVGGTISDAGSEGFCE